jgi:hypothetical protein
MWGAACLVGDHGVSAVLLRAMCLCTCMRSASAQVCFCMAQGVCDNSSRTLTLMLKAVLCTCGVALYGDIWMCMSAVCITLRRPSPLHSMLSQRRHSTTTSPSKPCSKWHLCTAGRAGASHTAFWLPACFKPPPHTLIHTCTHYYQDMPVHWSQHHCLCLATQQHDSICCFTLL